MRLRLEAGWQKGQLRSSLHPPHVIAHGTGQGPLCWADRRLPPQQDPSKPDNNLVKRGRGTREKEACSSGVDRSRQWESAGVVPRDWHILHVAIAGNHVSRRSTARVPPTALRATSVVTAGTNPASVRPPVNEVPLGRSSVNKRIKAS